MREISNIHAFEDERFLHACLVGSVAVLGVGALVGAGVFAVLPLFGRAIANVPAGGELMRLMPVSGWSIPAWLVGTLLLLVVSLAVHEGVHGLFFLLFAPPGSHVSFGCNRDAAMLYACAEGIVYVRRRYLLIILAPTVVVTALLVAIAVAGGYQLACYIVAALHLAGCVGDWYYAWAILRDRSIVACEDTSWGVLFLGEDAHADDACGEGADCTGGAL